jgi:hypothetical protein
MMDTVLSDLQYKINDQWQSLPDWGEFFVNIGSLAAQETGSRKLVIGITVPTRAYAAALVAAGVVVTRAGNSTVAASPNEHFEALYNAPQNTAVLFYEGKKVLKGLLKRASKDMEKTCGGKAVGIQLENEKGGGTTKYIMYGQCLKVRFANNAEVKLPKNQKGKVFLNDDDFLKSIHAISDVTDFVTETSLECAIIGYVAHLRSEITKTIFSYKQSGVNADNLVGNLQDLLRVRQFSSSGDGYHTEVLTALSEKGPQLQSDHAPYVAVFDGANGFSKWRHKFERSHWVVIFDRTEAQFEEATGLMNQLFFQSPEGSDREGPVELPDGIELVQFER